MILKDKAAFHYGFVLKLANLIKKSQSKSDKTRHPLSLPVMTLIEHLDYGGHWVIKKDDLCSCPKRRRA